MQLISAFAPAVIGGIGSLIGGAQSSAKEGEAANTALTGYNYLANNDANKAAQTAGTDAIGSEQTALGAQGQALAGQSATTGAATDLLTGAGTPQEQAAFKNYLDSTGYKFQLDQGTQALTGSAAARGILNSGATAKALTAYGQGLAGQSFNNYLGLLNTNAAAQGSVATGYGNQGTLYGDMTKTGVTAAGQVGQLGTTGGISAAAHQAAAGDDIGSATAQFGNLLGGAVGNYFGAKK